MGFRLAPWHIWPWMILNRPSWRSLELQSNISIRVYWMQQHWLDRRSIERISGYLWIFMELFDDMFVYDEFVMWLLSVALQWLWWPHCYVLFSCPWPWPWPWPCLSLYVTLIYRTPSDGAFRHTAGQVTLLFDELWADDVVLGVWVMPVDSRRTCSRSPGTCLSLSFCLSVCLSVCVCVCLCVADEAVVYTVNWWWINQVSNLGSLFTRQCFDGLCLAGVWCSRTYRHDEYLVTVIANANWHH